MSGQGKLAQPTAVASPAQRVLAALLALLCVLSAFVVIRSTHETRQLYARLQVLEARQWFLQEDHGRLLLEKSYWGSHHRVATEARDKLKFAAPALSQLRLVTP